MVTLVSALTGLNLMIGAGLGTLMAVPFGLRGSAAGLPLLVLAAIGGAVGVWLGVKVAVRFGGASGKPKGTRWATVAGIAGLLCAVVLSAFQVGVFVPIVAVLLPGFAAWLGDRLATRKG